MNNKGLSLVCKENESNPVGVDITITIPFDIATTSLDVIKEQLNGYVSRFNQGLNSENLIKYNQEIFDYLWDIVTGLESAENGMLVNGLHTQLYVNGTIKHGDEIMPRKEFVNMLRNNYKVSVK